MQARKRRSEPKWKPTACQAAQANLSPTSAERVQAEACYTAVSAELAMTKD
jgi:hypothetical protein